MSVDEIKASFDKFLSEIDFINKHNDPRVAAKLHEKVKSILTHVNLVDFLLEKIGIILLKSNKVLFSKNIETLAFVLSKANRINEVFEELTKKEFFKRNKLSEEEIKEWYFILSNILSYMNHFYEEKTIIALEKGGLANYLINLLKGKDINKKVFALRCIFNILFRIKESESLINRLNFYELYDFFK